MDPDNFRGPKFQNGYDPLWEDLLVKHAEKPFHVLVGGGDQLYCNGCVIQPPCASLGLEFPVELHWSPSCKNG
jgi:hypothetical protein